MCCASNMAMRPPSASLLRVTRSPASLSSADTSWFQKQPFPLAATGSATKSCTRRISHAPVRAQNMACKANGVIQQQRRSAAQMHQPGA